MKKNNLKNLIVTTIICLLPIIIGLIFYNELPENIAIHFDINNNPNNYFPKPVFIFGMPTIMALFQIIFLVTNDYSDKHPEANKKATTVYKWIIPILTIILYVVTIMYALGNMLDIRKIVMLLLGILFVIIGNYLPKTKGYRYVKVGKINEEHIKQKVARISGYALILDGILFMISTVFNTVVSVVLIGILILEFIGLHIYIYIKNRK